MSFSKPNAALSDKTEREHARNSFGLLLIVNEKPLNLEKTTYSIQSVIVNNGRTWKRSIGRLG